MKTNVEQSTRGRTLALTGAFLQVAFILASFGAVLGTRHIFKTSHGGDTDVQHLANSIGKVLAFSAVGAAIGLVGLVLLCVALVGSRYRAYWFFRFLVIYAVIIVFVFPLGTIFSIFFLVYCLTLRHEFLKPTIPAFH